MSSIRLVGGLDRRYTSSTSCTRYPCTPSLQTLSARRPRCLQNTFPDDVPDALDSATPLAAPRHSSDEMVAVVVPRHLNHLNTLHRRPPRRRRRSRRNGGDDDVFEGCERIQMSLRIQMKMMMTWRFHQMMMWMMSRIPMTSSL